MSAGIRIATSNPFPPMTAYVCHQNKELAGCRSAAATTARPCTATAARSSSCPTHCKRHPRPDVDCRCTWRRHGNNVDWWCTVPCRTAMWISGARCGTVGRCGPTVHTLLHMCPRTRLLCRQAAIKTVAWPILLKAAWQARPNETIAHVLYIDHCPRFIYKPLPTLYI